MKRLISLLLLIPSLIFGQTVTKVIDGGTGVGKFNMTFSSVPGATGPLPAFVFIPGNGETGQDASKLAINGPLKFAAGTWRNGFIIIGAQTPYQGGTYGNPLSLPFMRAVMREVARGNHGVDTTRIYLCGLSYGADHIMNYMQKEPDATFIAPAAAIPMSISISGQSGKYSTDALSGLDARFKNIPLWGFCGTSDAFYPYMSRFFSLLTAAGYVNKFTKYSGGHSGWNTYFDPNYRENGKNIYEWALQFSTKPAAPPVVVPANKYPIPVVAPIVPITAPQAWITLDGSGSSDPDGSIDSVAYTQVSGPSTATIISTSCDLKAAAVGLVPGTYIFKLQVWDNLKATSQLLVSVIVNPMPVTTLVTIPLYFDILRIPVTRNIIVKSDGSYSIQ